MAGNCPDIEFWVEVMSPLVEAKKARPKICRSLPTSEQRIACSQPPFDEDWAGPWTAVHIPSGVRLMTNLKSPAQVRRFVSLLVPRMTPEEMDEREPEAVIQAFSPRCSDVWHEHFVRPKRDDWKPILKF